MTPDPRADAPRGDLLQRLAEAIDGLVYSSESDRPFTVFYRAATEAKAPLSPATFAEIVGAQPEDPVEERSLERFLARHIELVDPLDRPAWARIQRYDDLRRLLASIPGMRVFRVGRVQVRCFAVGQDGDGNLIGIETVAIET